MHLAFNNRWGILNPNYTIINKFGILSHKMGCKIACSAYMANPLILDLLPSLLRSYYYHLDWAWGGHLTNKALVTTWVSPSRITCLNLRSPAWSKPSSKAFTSSSKAPNGNSSFLLIAPMIWPCSFLITILTPQLPVSLNTAPSTFTLYHPSHVRIHPHILRGAACFGNAFCELNSSTNSSASFAIASADLHRPSNFVAILFF